MAQKLIYPIVAVVGIAAASGAAWWHQNRSQAAGAADAAAPQAAASGPLPAASGPRPAAVETARVEVAKLVDDAQAVGNLRSRQSVVLRPEVSGRITELNFRDGDRVRKGQLLAQFDDQLPLAQVKQAQAELSIALANHKRNQELLAQNFISQRTVDESAANLEVAQAKLALARATAERLKVRAPFDGIAGIRLVSQGDYLKDGADIVNIEDIDAVYVDFRLPERFQTKVRKGQSANINLDALPGRTFSALIQAIDPLIDANGRSVAVRACIDNRQMQLRPGMFARVTAVFGVRERALVIPEEAIVPQGPRTFVVKVVDGEEPGSKVSQRVEVKLGVRRPGRVEVLEGLTETDTVVIAGHQRLQKDGSLLRVLDMSRARGEGSAPMPSPGSAPGAATPMPPASRPAAETSVATPGGRPGAPGRVTGAAAGGLKLAAATPGASGAPSGPNPCLVDLNSASTPEAAARPGGGRRP